MQKLFDKLKRSRDRFNRVYHATYLNTHLPYSNQPKLTQYEPKKEKFVDNAKKKGLKIIYPTDDTSPIIAHNKFENNRKTIIVISGTHGVEGYAGADVQIEILEKQNFDDINVIFVFGLNHWGFRHGQRYTKANIDLNRNVLVDGTNKNTDNEYTETPTNEYYTKDINSLFQSKIGSTDDVKTFVSLALAFMGKLKNPIKAGHKIMSGQYDFSGGFEFGGDELAIEHVYTIRNIKEIFGDKKASELIIMDLHTGVGKQVDENTGSTYILITDDNEETKLVTPKLEPDQQSRIRQGGSGVYHVTGSVMTGYKHHLKNFVNKQTVVVTQEFATKDVREIFVSLVERRDGNILYDLFYIDEDWWKNGIKKQGLDLYNSLVT